MIDGSLVFVDISGFTNLSERLARRGRIGAEELTGVLNRVFGHMLEIVFSRGGSLLKFGGDALLLLFDTDDHVMQACAATVEMRAALREASKEKTSVGRINLKMSSGIHTGPIDFFLVGDSHRELLVTGPTASVTTKMEGTADAGEIVVSEAVKADLPADFTGDAKGDGWLLRKQRISLSECGPVVRESGDEPDLTAYVPRRLREQLQTGIGDSEHRIATIGFLKYKGIDALLSADGPESVGKKLDDLVRVVQAAVDAEGITFLASDIDADGGKIILAAGVPASQHDDEGRMLRAARQILDSDLDLTARMGLNRGHVFAGDVGSSFRRTFTVMGDTVNLAARLMAAAGPGGLYSSPAVLDEASTLFRTEPLEPFYVKGKDEPVRAYQVFEEIGVRPPELSHDLPFHGREAEVDMLVSIITTCARVGRGGMMTVSGETGIGKTRLIVEVLERCPGLATLMIKAEPNGSTNPYWAFRDPMRRKLGIERADTQTMAESLEEMIQKTAPEVLPLVPLLGDVLHIDIPDNETTGAIDPRFRPDRTADAVVDLLTALHAEPFAVITEDGQWLDDASTNLLRRIGAAAETRPWTTIVTIRESEEIAHEKFGDEVGLAPLDDETIRQIANEVTAGAPLRPHELDKIVTRVGGNPLFLSEILSVIRETGNADDIPDSLDAVVSTQIDSLPPLARQTLRYSSVLGTSFPIEVLDRYLAVDDMEIDDATRSELDRFMDRDGDTRLRFKHAVVHGVAYRGLPYRRRRELHERAGQVVEKMNARNPNIAAEFLAYHYSEAGRHEKAWRYSTVAAAKAKQAFANAEAAAHFERALESAKHLSGADSVELSETWTGLGEVHDLTGDYEQARRAFSKAIAVGPDDPVRAAELYLRRAETWMGSGNLPQAKRSITLGRKAIGQPRHRDSLARLAKLIAYEARVHAADGDPVKASQCAREAVRLGEDSGEQEAIAHAYGVLDWANFMLGVDERRHGPEAIEIYQRLGSLAKSAAVMNNMGAFAYMEGKWDEAVDWYRESLEGAEGSGDVFSAALTRANLAEILISQRKYGEAEEPLDHAERVYRASHASHFMPLIQLQRARLAIGRGDPGLATQLLEQSLEHHGESAWTAEARLTLAESLARSGRPSDALRRLESIGGPSAETDGLANRIALVKGLALEQLGETESAMSTLESALSSARSADETYESVLVAEALVNARALVGLQTTSPELERLDAERSKLGIEALEPVST